MARRIKMNKTYLIKLKPTGKYFFGGDAAFKVGTEGPKNFDSAFSSYILKSNKMPQQTSLLGMMRFLLLSNNKDLFDKENNQIKDAEDLRLKMLIGERGFTICAENTNANKQEDDEKFGCISKIGPCFIMDRNGKCFFRAPMDYGLKVDFRHAVRAVINGVEVELPDIVKEDAKKTEKHYSGKDGLTEIFMAVDGTVVIDKCLFIKDERIGINKNYIGKTEKDGFYKQISYRLQGGYCFAFEAEIDESIDLTQYNSQLVRLGADSSSFVFEAEFMDEKTRTIIYPKSQGDNRVVLLSDTYFPKMEDVKQYAFSISGTRPFRFLESVNSSNRADYNLKSKFLRSNRYELFCAGSVFYFRNTEQHNAFCDLIGKFSEFVQIGYNRYY